MIEGFRDFEFDLPEALLVSLIRAFDGMSSTPLLTENVRELPEAQGVYQLLHDGAIVYIGKTDAEAGLRQRLSRHAWTIQHRCNLEPGRVSFKAIRVYVFTAIDLETQLIDHYESKTSVSWNKSGFGSNDPGRQRDDTKLKANGFDANFPIDLDRPILIDAREVTTPAALLNALRAVVPYTVRSELDSSSRRKPHPDLEIDTVYSQNLSTARAVMKAVVESLPTGWQATLLPGRIILYKERKSYSAGSVIAVS